MFNIFKKSKVVFICTQEAFKDLYPPIYSKDLQRPFLQKINSDYQHKAKQPVCPFRRLTSTAKCDGIRDIISAGYIIRLHRDLKINTNGDGETFTWEKLSCGFEKDVGDIGWFSPGQYADYINLPPQTLRTVLKIHTPWLIETDDFCFIQTHPSFCGEHRFTVVEGILDPLRNRQVNSIMFWHVLQGGEVLKAGTPIAQLIPIHRKFLPELVITTEDKRQLQRKMTNYLIASNATTANVSPSLFGI